MTYQEAVAYLESLSRFGSKLGLERMQKLAELLGNPQKDLKFLHIAGTNGKGSTVAMLSAILQAAGLQVGTFTSPHLSSFRSGSPFPTGPSRRSSLPDGRGTQALCRQNSRAYQI